MVTLALFFELPASIADYEQWDRVQTVQKAYGRLETHTLESTTGDCAFVGWPGAIHLPCRTCERMVMKAGKTTRKVTYGVTNLQLVKRARRC